MICSNIDCKKEFIPKRSFAEYCTKTCARKAYYLNNKEKLKQLKKKYCLKNKDKIKEYQKIYQKEYWKQYYLNNKNKKKEWRLKNKDKKNKYQREYQLKNPHLRNAITAKYRALKLLATPKFANLNKIKEIYKNCPKGFHVDHIIPLNNKMVCGLHVEWNLQYLTPYDNKSKSNKLIV
jgi:hypothetical protein